MDLTSWAAAFVVASLFPLIAVVIYQRRQRLHDRAMGRRRTQKIEL